MGPQVLLQTLNRVIRIDLNSIVHLNLQNQVRSAFQVEAEVYPLLDGREQSVA